MSSVSHIGWLCCCVQLCILQSSRKLREKRIIRPRTPSSPSASPSPTLKQQQRQQHVSVRDANTVAEKNKETDVASDGVKKESGRRGRDAIPRGDSSEQLQSSVGSEREAFPGGAVGAGVLESLPRRGTLDERGREMQRPRRMRGTLRSAIPADAVIVEVRSLVMPLEVSCLMMSRVWVLARAVSLIVLYALITLESIGTKGPRIY